MKPSKLRTSLVHFATNLHRVIFSATGGRVANRGMGMPVLMLTTTGRRSGKPHVSMLTSPVQLDDKIVVVASYGGNDRHPAWYLNLRDNPSVHAVMQNRSGAMRARTASGQERADLWQRVIERAPVYAEYQRQTAREIPLVILEPAN